MEPHSPQIEHIAVVDDDYTRRRIIGDFLEDEGFDVTISATPEEIADRIDTFNIIIMDVRLSRERPTGGIDFVIEQCRAGKISRQTTLVFISQWGKDRAGVPERLKQLDEYHWEWQDVSTGMEITELRAKLRRGSK